MLGGATDRVPILDATDLSLDEWLARVPDPRSPPMVRAHFPTAEHRREFLERIGEFSPQTIEMLLRRFLPCNGTHPLDVIFLLAMRNSGGELGALAASEHGRRLRLYEATRGAIPVWEGIHWVIGLLPSWPQEALRALSAFFQAHCQDLPDQYLNGLSDAQRVIRARYIVGPHTRDVALRTLATLEWREFELLVALAWEGAGYKVTVSRGSKDGGIDIHASRGKGERSILIQCKHWRGPVGVEECNQVTGVMDRRRGNQAVVVASSRFTRGARKLATEDDRLRLVDGRELTTMLNRGHGVDWPANVDTLVSKAQRAYSPESVSRAPSTPKEADRPSRDGRPTRATKATKK